MATELSRALTGFAEPAKFEGDIDLFRGVADDLDRALGEEKAMLRTLTRTIKRLDREGEALRRQARG